jgi:hypothetical protein
MDAGTPTLGETVIAVWRQALSENLDEVELPGQKCRVTRTRSAGLRVVLFSHGGQQIEGIEQNPETKSRWAALARAGSRIMQFRYRGRYIGNVCDGTLMRYPGWKAAGLSD